MPRIRSIKPETGVHRWNRDALAPATPGGALLYRIRASDHALLYVGVTQNPIERWRSHAQHKTWWSQVASIESEDHSCIRAALKAERDAIRREHPIHNRRSVVS